MTTFQKYFKYKYKYLNLIGKGKEEGSKIIDDDMYYYIFLQNCSKEAYNHLTEAYQK
jgi:hypothetical protein